MDDLGTPRPAFWQAYKIPILLGSVSILLIILSVTILVKSHQSSAPIEFHSSQREASIAGTISTQITVDIEGAVQKPGVYELPLGSRVVDAISLAGGLALDADTEGISEIMNRAAKLSDGAKLYIPKKGSVLKKDQGLRPILQAGQALDPVVFAQVSINAASQSELEALAGIGPVTAQKIINGRPYQTIEELVTKKSLSKSLFEKLKDQLTL